MLMQKRRLVFGLFSLLVLGVIVAACGPSATRAPAATQAPAAAATAVPAGPKACNGSGVVNVWSDGDTNITDWLSNKIGPAFQKACPQYTVKVTTVRGVGAGMTDVAQRTL